MPSELLTERRGATLVLTISDVASRNTLSTQVIAAGIEALDASEANREIRAVVLQGDGAHFCAGGNVQGLVERRAAGEATQRRMIDHLHQWVEAIAAYPKPVIAADDARFVMSHGKLGLSPDGGATARLAAALPAALVKQIVWLAEPVSAATLHAHGVVAVVAGHGEALAAALAMAERLAALAPEALASVKELVAQAPGRPLVDQLAAERDHFLANLFAADGAEGLQAFLEKRAPRFR